MKYVYVAGPLTNGGWALNLHLAVKAGEALRREGFVPFVPHLMIQWEIIAPGASYEEWLQLCFAWIQKCDALIRLPGLSPGSDREVAFAKTLNIPVFYAITAFLEAYRRKKGLAPLERPA